MLRIYQRRIAKIEDAQDQSAQSRQKAVEFSGEVSKQVITLSTALITLAVGGYAGGLINSLKIAILTSSATFLLFISNVGGIFALYALSGILETNLHYRIKRPLLSRNYRVAALCQFFSFLGALFILLTTILLWPYQKTTMIENSTCVEFMTQLRICIIRSGPKH